MSVTGIRRRSQAERSIHDAAVKAVSTDVPRRRRGKAAQPKRSLKQRLVDWVDLPDFLKDNEYIVGSYRPEQSFRESIKTLFVLHNETGNVWTHILGFFLFVALAFFFCTHTPTPLAVTAEHVEVLLHDLQQQLQQQLHSLHVGGNLQALGQGLLDKVHALEHSLQDRVHALEHRLQDGVHALEGRLSESFTDNLHQLQDNIHSLQDSMHAAWQGSALGDKLHQLQDSLHNVELSLQLKAAGLGSNLASRAGVVQAALLQQLKPILQWPVPRWPVYVYFAGAMVCLLTSSVCHLLGCCKQHIAEMIWRFDYAGIAVLIVASFVPAMYYAFLCEPWWRNFYLITTVSMGCVVIGMSLPTMFQARHYRGLRAAIFTMLGAWGVVPVTQLLLTNGHVWAIRRAFMLDLLMGAIYVGGAVVYACRVPERWSPGRFDIAGHSHQLWHAAVVLAAWVHYCAIMVLLQWRDASGGCAAGGTGVHDPVHEVLGRMQQAGQAPMQLEQLPDFVQQYVARRGL